MPGKIEVFEKKGGVSWKRVIRRCETLPSACRRQNIKKKQEQETKQKTLFVDRIKRSKADGRANDLVNRLEQKLGFPRIFALGWNSREHKSTKLIFN